MGKVRKMDIKKAVERKKEITSDEWNKLPKDEKVKRIKKFEEHMRQYEKKGIPTGMSDLRRLAIQYGTPILKRE